MKRLLLIDDDEELLPVLAAYLSRLGYEVETASDGVIGVERFHAKPCDLVVTDLILPNREGIETILQLRKERPELPIIAMSGGLGNSPQYLGLAKRLGAKCALLKPFSPESLKEAIERLLPPG